MEERGKRTCREWPGFVMWREEETYCPRNKSRRTKYADRVMVGKNIRERRSQAEMTQQALADSTHMTRFMVSKLERGMRSPTIDQAIRIADALRCSVESLIYDDSLSPHD